MLLRLKYSKTRVANAHATSGPDVHRPKAKSMDGEVGEPVVFNIYYRSRRMCHIQTLKRPIVII